MPSNSDASPWVGTSGETLQQVKDTYANAIIVDDVNGFDNVLVDSFVARIEKFGLNKDDLDIVRHSSKSSSPKCVLFIPEQYFRLFALVRLAEAVRIGRPPSDEQNGGFGRRQPDRGCSRRSPDLECHASTGI